MTILTHGKLISVTRCPRYFSCLKCGCRFVAEPDEYKVHGDNAPEPDAVSITVECPDCHNKITGRPIINGRGDYEWSNGDPYKSVPTFRGDDD